jgi:hypothetical protein
MAVEREIVELERDDVLRRAERSRNALLAAVERVPDARLSIETAEEWGVLRLLRHVVWVEHYWTLIIQRCLELSRPIVEIDATVSNEIARQTSRRAGTPEEPVPVPPPYATRDEALSGMRISRDGYVSTLRSLNADHFRTRVATARVVVPLRFAVEHVIEHDWDHALQIAAGTPR